MKRKFSVFFLGLAFLTGLGIFTYPKISDQWNKYHQSKAVISYEEAIVQLDDVDFEEIWSAARAYNQTITKNTFDGEVFSQEEIDLKETEYWSVLNIENNGIMGYLSIPKIDQTIPIYHGTSDSVLQVGVGHLSGTKLPIGGEGNHSVLSGHRGLPSAKLFSDIDQMEVGDRFYIHILGEVFAYEVDQIFPMVEKDDYETLEQAMQNEEGQDYVTLFTCTPYGINSHRLLVRGTRVAYYGEDEPVVEGKGTIQTLAESIKDYYMFYIIAAVVVIIVIVAFARIIRKIRTIKRTREEKHENV